MSEVNLPPSYYLRNLAYPSLPFMPKPCRDCPVLCGFYEPYSADMKDKIKNVDVLNEVSKRWFCHSNIKRACRGNSNYLGVTNE